MKTFELQTRARTEFVEVTARVQAAVAELGLAEGVVTVFAPHTTAGMTINENADPDVVADLQSVLDALAPWRGAYRHGEGNSAAHVKATLVGSSVRVCVAGGRLRLGAWQGIYFCEFDGPRSRQVWVAG